MLQKLNNLYRHITLDRPWISWVLLGILLGSSAFYAQNFRLDASSDSLLLQNDKSLAYFRQINERYGTDDFLVVTYTPKADLFSNQSLQALQSLSDELAALPRVKSVTSILNVPLIDSPRMSLGEIQKGIRTLSDPDTDHKLAKQEFLTSPLYNNLLINDDATTTALQLTLKPDPEAERLYEQRQALRDKQAAGELDAAGQARLERAEAAYRQASERAQAASQQTITAVRGILDGYRGNAKIHLGGVSMIASDMIDFVASDIRVFGIGIVGFLVILLAVTFHRLRWVFIPALICIFSTTGMLGILGVMDWPVTVVSSNFISLALIITLSLVIHLIVRYRELHHDMPDAAMTTLIAETMRSKFLPSFFTAVTTMVSFASLVVSDIKPVIDFGKMMVWSVGIAFVVTFLFFPAGLITMTPGKAAAPGRNLTGGITGGLARIVEHQRRKLLAIILILVVILAYGISLLSVENRFIDYFKPSTEIYQGMLQIDRELGGTTPLDVILDAEPGFAEEQEALGLEGLGITGSSYWFNGYQLDEIERIHAYLNDLPETGKVLSLHTTMAMLTTLNNDEQLDDFSLSVMYGRLPEQLKQQLLAPYMSEDGNQIRFSIRVIDSYPGLSRDELLQRIRSDLIDKFDLQPEQVHLSGLLVLYNNVLQSLFNSQILTLSVVFVAIFLMLALMFRNALLAFIGVMPTLFAATTILGLMGWLGIPLDIMTITIAAITIGIGVDDTIHYLHRIREEYAVDRDFNAAMYRSHTSVGKAMFYTSVVITAGFSILTLSNFIPSIYFGLLTGLAMMVALLANLTLLPALLAGLRKL